MRFQSFHLSFASVAVGCRGSAAAGFGAAELHSLRPALAAVNATKRLEDASEARKQEARLLQIWRARDESLPAPALTAADCLPTG